VLSIHFACAAVRRARGSYAGHSRRVGGAGSRTGAGVGGMDAVRGDGAGAGVAAREHESPVSAMAKKAAVNAVWSSRCGRCIP
jgi:hypothetical protein